MSDNHLILAGVSRVTLLSDGQIQNENVIALHSISFYFFYISCISFD